MFFSDWYSIYRASVMGCFGYVCLVILLRASGKRTLSKMNMFDFVVTIAFGSMLASVILNKDIKLAEWVVGIGVLIGGQFVITWLSVRSAGFRKIVKAAPRLVYARGSSIEEAMRKERVTLEEVLAAARSAGVSSLTDQHAVILETDGSLTVVEIPKEGLEGGTLAGTKAAEKI